MRIKLITFRRLLRQLFGLSVKWEDMPMSTRYGRDLDMWEEIPTTTVVLPVFPGKWLSKEDFHKLVVPCLQANLPQGKELI